MRDQIIEITNQFPLLSVFNRLSEKKEVSQNQDGAFWMRVYSPLSDGPKVSITGSRQLCPWGMAAEIADAETLPERKRHILNAFKSGQKAIRLFNLSPRRIMFMEEQKTQRITIWVD